VARLSHPNIVPLHFIGQKDDLVYLAMECLDGGSLADRLEREGRLPIEDARRVLVDVAGALAHAHRRGVVHRDIKPQNVLLDAESGRALVTDFGIARMSDSDSLTATGVVLGTPAYLAPEQVSGEPSDHRADIYAFGALAYEILAGQPPFTGAVPSAVLLKRLAGPPVRITSLRPDVPLELHELIERCLAVEPADRFQSADDVVRALTGQTPPSGGHTTERRVKRKQQQRTGIGIAIVAVVLVSGWVARNQLRERGKGTPLPTASIQDLDEGMARIPAGEYTIGADAGPADAPHRPAHRATLAAFGLDRREVTVAEFRVYVDSMRVALPWSGIATSEPELPVTHVGFADALNYCRWRHPTGGRLPTEEEWEAAARGVEARLFPWGNEPIVGRANTASAARDAPAPVGAFPAGETPDHIVDLIGNVWEWTSSSAPPYPGGTRLSGASSPDQSRVIRGGGFNTPESLANPWTRAALPLSAPAELLQATGFRCAMTPRTPRT
jgi:formylglycine-generating enzyme required for sulfatase activity